MEAHEQHKRIKKCLKCGNSFAPRGIFDLYCKKCRNKFKAQRLAKRKEERAP